MPTTNTEYLEHPSVLESHKTEKLAEGFRALADPHRLRILHLLMRCGEMCVCECTVALGLSQSNLSFHLKTLKHAGFIKARKSGKWTYYSLNRSKSGQFLKLWTEVFDFENWPEKSNSTTCEEGGYCEKPRP